MAKKTRAGSQTGQQTKEGFVSTQFEAVDIPDYVLVELRYESPVSYTASKFVAASAVATEADALNKVLEKYDIPTIRSHFGLKATDLRARVDVAATLPPEPNPEKFAKKGMDTKFIQSGFVEVVPKKSSDAKKIAAALTGKKGVWKA